VRPITQTSDGIGKGNCLQAALASVLELPLDEVPHSVVWPDEEWFERLNAWLSQRLGLVLISVSAEGWKIPESIFHIISGSTPGTGVAHAVVGRGGQIVHDPHEAKPGLVPEGRLFWLFVRVDPAVDAASPSTPPAQEEAAFREGWQLARRTNYATPDAAMSEWKWMRGRRAAASPTTEQTAVTLTTAPLDIPIYDPATVPKYTAAGGPIRRNFSELRAKMSPEGQERARQRTEEMLRDLGTAASLDTGKEP